MASDSNRLPGILVTRPSPQAKSTLKAINQLGWHAYHYPTIDLKKHANSSPEITKTQLEQSDWLIFISQPAVRYFFTDFSPDDISSLKIAAVGNATKQALEALNVHVDAYPEATANSEALLELEAFKNVQGQKIMIVRGIGGRELLYQTLTERGATVSYLEVYERMLASPDQDLIRNHWEADIDVVLCTSNQLLENYRLLVEPLLGNKIFSKPVLVISPRMQDYAKQAGFSKIWLAEGPGNDQMIKTIKTHLQLD